MTSVVDAACPSTTVAFTEEVCTLAGTFNETT
jgi:hypothetical protein